METLNLLSDPVYAKDSVDAVIHAANRFKEKYGRKAVLMEVCGSHTMAIAKSGIKTRLKDDVQLIAGPGCPVCVTDQESIDSMIQLSQESNRILCTFGDMMRVPGSKFSLMQAKTEGKDIRVVYSPLDTLKIAEQNPDKEVIFLGIGFETTIPILALTIQEAMTKRIKNFSIWMTTKLVEPVLRNLLESGQVKVDGFILPGQVSVVLGKNRFLYLAKDYKIPGVISGFEPVQLLRGIYRLLNLLIDEKAEIINDYTYAVKDEGNQIAQNLINDYLMPNDEGWRGIGIIPESGLDLKEQYARFDAKKKFNITIQKPKMTKCRCGEIIRGLISPEDCSLFNKGCSPINPIGPCMVSAEGTCAAHYQYMREE
ncbi:hydrogenase formation protein HypD [Fictibacillus sp. b24]|uniref:hydrogenase formation protein HypD n=1 Tax=Fictibacillus sp. b24 TaxID=3055863 RepID=UPI0025A1A4FD|nr:hydrogenase formation protein HypD [Fictibacillus sp. b24]MDM5315424.1 hydrogenase formation protein HypD [Fictibacillus sp. b24]